MLICKPMNCSPPGSSVHRISQASTPEWVAISFLRGSSRPRPWTCMSYLFCTGGWIFTTSATWEVCISYISCLLYFTWHLHVFMKETLLKIKYHLSHYVSREFYMSIFIVISGNRWISLMLNIDYLKSFLHILSCQCMQLYLNENLCFEEGLMPSRIVVLQLLQALSCLYFSVTFYPEKENETFWGLREHL